VISDTDGHFSSIMSDQPIENNAMPDEIDFSKGTRGLDHISTDAEVLMPASTGRTSPTRSAEVAKPSRS
jgi:hypothetical protein